MLSYAKVDLAPICDQEMLQRSPEEQSMNREGTQWIWSQLTGWESSKFSTFLQYGPCTSVL